MAFKGAEDEILSKLALNIFDTVKEHHLVTHAHKDRAAILVSLVTQYSFA